MLWLFILGTIKHCQQQAIVLDRSILEGLKQSHIMTGKITLSLLVQDDKIRQVMAKTEAAILSIGNQV
jgi:hypothetical protein